MLFLKIAASVLVAFLLVRFALRIAAAAKFVRLLKWLEMDMMEVAKFVERRDAQGLFLAVVAKLRERNTLLMFRVEREIKKAHAEGILPDEDAEFFLGAVDYSRTISEAFRGPWHLNIIGLAVQGTPPPEIHRVTGPLIAESEELVKWTQFFFGYLNKHGRFVTRQENGTP